MSQQNNEIQPRKNITFDLHYHTNIYRQTKSNRDTRLQQHHESLSKTKVDFVASTEHGYKNPLDAFLYLKDATQDLSTTILPAVEAVSSEGVDIIFIFKSEEDLKIGLKSLPPFGWSAKDMNQIRDELGAINIIPHPYTPGKTGLANTMGEESFLTLQKTADYIETHNGLSLHFLENGLKNKKLLKIPSLQKKVDYTYRLPDHLRTPQTGLAVSSDAHFPFHQEIVGKIEIQSDMNIDETNWFSFLKKRHHFKKHFLIENSAPQYEYTWKMLQSSFCTMEEAIEKRAQKIGLLKPATLSHPKAQ